MNRRTFALGCLALVSPQDLPPIHDAAAHGRTDEVNRLLASDQTLVFALDDKGNTPLHHAAWNNQLEVARLLLVAGAKVDSPRLEGKVTPLEMASYYGHEELVRLLVGFKADVNVRVYEGYTPLHQAVRNGHVGVARFLIERGAKLDVARDNGRYPLHTAAENGHLEAVLYLLALGADPTLRDRSGKTPAGVAANDAVRQAILRVMEARADTEARRTALALAIPKEAQIKKVEIVYESRFASGVLGPEWTTSALGAQWAELRISTSTRGDRLFLGPLGSQEVRLALGKLPSHHVLRIAFDLWIRGTWDGNGTPTDGPDLISVALLEGPTLMSATFFNPGDSMTGAKLQSFPDDYPLGNHLGGTGAVEKTSEATLYRLAFNLTHTAPSAVFRFMGRGLEGLENESWGLSNVRVATLSLK